MPNLKILKSKYGQVRNIVLGNKFTRELKRLEKDHKNDIIEEIKRTVDELASFNVSKEKSNHPLKGKLSDYDDIHISGDLILVYEYRYGKLYVDLYAHDIVTHKELKRK